MCVCVHVVRVCSRAHVRAYACKPVLQRRTNTDDNPPNIPYQLRVQLRRSLEFTNDDIAHFLERHFILGRRAAESSFELAQFAAHCGVARMRQHALEDPER